MKTPLKKRSYALECMYRNCDKITNRYRRLKDRAKRANIPLKITMAQHEAIIKDRTCYYCDYNFSGHHGSGLHRIDSSKGYIMGNLNPCCGVCNRILGELRQEEAKLKIGKIIKALGKLINKEKRKENKNEKMLNMRKRQRTK